MEMVCIHRRLQAEYLMINCLPALWGLACVGDRYMECIWWLRHWVQVELTCTERSEDPGTMKRIRYKPPRGFTSFMPSGQYRCRGGGEAPHLDWLRPYHTEGESMVRLLGRAEPELTTTYRTHTLVTHELSLHRLIRQHRQYCCNDSTAASKGTQYICATVKHYLLWSVSRCVPVRFWKRRQKTFLIHNILLSM